VVAVVMDSEHSRSTPHESSRLRTLLMVTLMDLKLRRHSSGWMPSAPAHLTWFEFETSCPEASNSCSEKADRRSDRARESMEHC
jgi:hypothetical protein